jgi:hypothetical protein
LATGFAALAVTALPAGFLAGAALIGFLAAALGAGFLADFLVGIDASVLLKF